LKNKIILFSIISIILFACDAAEDLFTERKAPNVGPIQNNSGTEINPGDTLEFSVSATNPEDGELSYEWSANAGNIIGSINETVIRWKAPLGGGTYRINVKVSNDYKNTRKYIDIIVWSNTNPNVNINYPTNGMYLIQHTPIELDFDAFHSNGIAMIFIYINNQKIDSLNGLQVTNYTYDRWDVDSPSGETEIKVEAVSINNTHSSDRINVTIEGILPGKTDD
jgi:Big-like domain-containing protein